MRDWECWMASRASSRRIGRLRFEQTHDGVQVVLDAVVHFLQQPAFVACQLLQQHFFWVMSLFDFCLVQNNQPSNTTITDINMMISVLILRRAFGSRMLASFCSMSASFFRDSYCAFEFVGEPGFANCKGRVGHAFAFQQVGIGILVVAEAALFCDLKQVVGFEYVVFGGQFLFCCFEHEWPLSREHSLYR